MMIFTSIYSVVDGFFVSNFAGSTALAAVNFAFPVVTLFSTVGFMLGTGGGAIVARTRGEGDAERANRIFSLLVYASAASSVIALVVGMLLLRPIVSVLGAKGALLEQSMLYGTILMGFLPAVIMQYCFQGLTMAAGKPKLGLASTVAAGVANIVFDAVFIVGLKWGVMGAALGTGRAELVGALVPIVYFARPNDSPHRLGRTSLDWGVLGQASFNGLSEVVTSVALSLVSLLYNFQLLRILGEDGVAAYGVIMYVSFLFMGVFMGYATGSGPLMSFQHGACNRREMRSLFLRGIGLNAVFGVGMLLLCQLLARLLAWIFVGYDAQLAALAEHGLRLYSIAFVFMGFNIYGSSFFTSLSNGKVSAIISFVRTVIFEAAAVLLLPLLLGADGIWLSVSVAELASLVMTAAFTIGLAPQYGYLQKS